MMTPRAALKNATVFSADFVFPFFFVVVVNECLTSEAEMCVDVWRAMNLLLKMVDRDIRSHEERCVESSDVTEKEEEEKKRERARALVTAADCANFWRDSIQPMYVCPLPMGYELVNKG